MSCVECGSIEKLQVHHTSYFPIKTEILCVICHQKEHKNHGVGSAKFEKLGLGESKNVTMVCRITHKTREAINKIIIMDTHLNESDFIRAAIREKILRDAPQLLKEMLEEG